MTQYCLLLIWALMSFITIQLVRNKSSLKTKSQLKCQVLGQGQFVMDLLMKRGCFYLVSLITLSECSVTRMINYNLLLVIEYQTIHKTSHHKLFIGEMKFTLLYEVMIKSLYFQMKRIS